MLNLLTKSEFCKNLFGDIAPAAAGFAAWVIGGGIWGVLFGMLSLALFLVRILDAYQIMYTKKLANKKTEIEVRTMMNINADMTITIEQRLEKILENFIKKSDGKDKN